MARTANVFARVEPEAGRTGTQGDRHGIEDGEWFLYNER